MSTSLPLQITYFPQLRDKDKKHLLFATERKDVSTYFPLQITYFPQLRDKDRDKKYKMISLTFRTRCRGGCTPTPASLSRRLTSPPVRKVGLCRIWFSVLGYRISGIPYRIIRQYFAECRISGRLCGLSYFNYPLNYCP